MSDPICKIVRSEKAKQYPMLHHKCEGDVGYDLVCTEDTVLFEGTVTNVPTGIRLEIPDGYWVEIRPRSSSAFKGIHVFPATIDTGYRGELFVCARTIQDLPFGVTMVKAGERIAQMIVKKVHHFNFIEVDEISESERGDNGFGSTGH